MYSATWVIDRVCTKCMNKNTYTRAVSPPKFWVCSSCGGRDRLDNLHIIKYTNNGIEKIKPTIAPHFWVRTQDINKVFAAARAEGVTVTSRFSSFSTLAKEPVTQIDFKTPIDGSKVHYALGNDIPLEGDRAGSIGYLRQWMEESNITCTPVYDRVLFFDLECRNEGGFPVPEYDPIVSIGMIINGEETWLHGPEADMLKQFWKIVSEKRVQMVVAWNGLEFDFEYIKFRSRKYGISVDFDCVRWLDLMAVYRYIKAQRVRNDLDSAGMDTVGRGKKVHGRKEIGDLETKGLLEDYNMEDCRLMVDINKKLNLIPIMTALANEGRLFPDEALGVHEDLSTPSPLIDAIILYNSHQRKYVLPTKKKHNAKPYKGAIVLDPKAGLYKNVLQLDFSCLRGNTVVVTKRGSIKVSDIRENDEVFTPYGWQRVRKVYAYDIKAPLVRIETHGGRVIESTLNHKFPVIVQNNVKERTAEYIQRGTQVVVLDQEPPVYRRDDIIKLFGAFLAEGTYVRKDAQHLDSRRRGQHRISHQYKIEFNISSKEVDFRRFIISTLRSRYPGIHVYEKKLGSKGISLSISQKMAVEDFKGRVDAFLSGTHTLEEEAAFLSGFFEGAGSVNPGRRAVEFNQPTDMTQKNLDIVFQYLRALGIPFARGKSTYPRTINRCEIGSLYGMTKFYTSVGFISPTKAERLHGAMYQRMIRAKHGRYPRFGLYTHAQRTSNGSRHPYIGLDRVKDKTIIPFAGKVYDITLEWSEFPYYFANGILTHNSLYPSSMISWRISFDPEEEIIPAIMRKYYTKKESAKSDDERQATKIVLNACFTGDTSYVSLDGLKNIKDAKVGDAVVNVNPKTLEPEIDTITDVQAYDYRGDLFSFGPNAGSLVVTPEHKFLVEAAGVHRFVPVAEMVERSYKIPRITTPTWLSNTVRGDVPQRLNARHIALTCKMAQKEAKRGRTILTTKAGADRLIPTMSLLGYYTTVGPAKGGVRIRLGSGPRKITPKAVASSSLPWYDGRVYCVTTKNNHTLLAGRNGKIVLTGQSYGVFASQYFRLYRPDLAEEIARRARDFFISANEILGKLGLEVLYGDSVIGSTEISVKTKRMAAPRTMTIESLWNLYRRKAQPRIDGKEEINFAKLGVGIKTQAITAKGAVVTAPIRTMIRNESPKPCFLVQTASGKRLVVTKDHSLIGPDGVKIPPGGAVGKEVMAMKDGNKATERVVSVTPVDVSPYVVYDLDVEKAHTFLANGVFVSNTDSAFIHLGDYVVNAADAKPVSDNIMARFNKLFNEYWDPRVKDNTFKVKFVPNAFWSELLIPARAGGAKAAKKRYAGYVLFDKKWNQQPRKEPEVTGLELVRSDWAELAKEVQKTLIRMKLDNASDDAIRAYIDSIKEGLFAGKYDHKLLIRKGISKVGRLNDAMREDPIGELRKLYTVDTRVIKALKILKKEEIIYFMSNKFVEFIMVIKERPYALIDPDVLPPNIDYRWYFKKQILAIAERLGISYEPPTAALDQWS
jgi:DNA polymerase elongation subunit (family B)